MGFLDTFRRKKETVQTPEQMLYSRLDKLEQAFKGNFDKEVYPNKNRKNLSTTRIRGKVITGKSVYYRYDQEFPYNEYKTERYIQGHNYDLHRIKMYYMSDSYVARAVNNHVNDTLKQGFDIVGEDKKTLTYVKDRLRDMSLATNTTLNKLMLDMTMQLVLYSNLFVYKKLDIDSSTGRPWRRWDGKTIKPIAGIFVENAPDVFVITDKKGRVTNFEHIPVAGKEGIERYPVFKRVKEEDLAKYNTDEMDHVTYNKTRGEIIAMPLIWPVIDDIRTLRLVEECIELLSFQYAHPILHATVGNDERPGDLQEVIDTQNYIDSMAGNGSITTSDRVKMAFLGAESRALRLEGYLDYFKNRVFAGLYMSEVQMGEGDTANRGTASAISKTAQNYIISLQNILADYWNKIFDQLLMEAGYTYRELNDENRVRLTFPPVDIDQKTLLENHNLQLFLNKVITHDEMRNSTGRRPIYGVKEEEDKLYHNYIEIPLNESIGKAEMENQLQLQKYSNSLSNPTNQYGTRSTGARSSQKKNDLSDLIISLKDDFEYDDKSIIEIGDLVYAVDSSLLDFVKSALTENRVFYKIRD